MGAQTPSGQLSNLLHNTFGFTQLVRLEGRGIGIDLTLFILVLKKNFGDISWRCWDFLNH